jgi:hypothetical protein
MTIARTVPEIMQCEEAPLASTAFVARNYRTSTQRDGTHPPIEMSCMTHNWCLCALLKSRIPAVDRRTACVQNLRLPDTCLYSFTGTLSDAIDVEITLELRKSYMKRPRCMSARRV